MGFLSGVLGAVKDENEVTTYDKYITDPEKRLNKVIEKVQSSIGSGREGLAVSVGAVKGWLEGYEREVGKKTKAVTDSLATLIKAKIEKHANEINQHNDLSTQLIFRAHVLGDASFEIEKIENEHVNKLDNSLKEKVQNKIEPIKKSVAMLANSAKQDKFVKQAAKVESELVQQKMKIQQELHLRFLNIFNGIDSLKDARKQGMNGIKDHLNDAMKLVDKELGNHQDNFKNNILYKFAEIKDKLSDVDKDQFRGGVDGMTRLRNDVTSIRSQLSQVETQLGQRVKELTDWNAAAGSAVSKAKGKCKQIVEKVHHAGGEQNTEIGKNDEDLKKKASALLKAYEKAHAAVDTLAKSTVTAAIEDLEENIKTDLYTIKEGIKSGLKQVIDALKAGIANAMEDDRGTLFVQEFSLGLGGKYGNAPKLYAWADAIKNSSTLKDAIGNLQWKSNAFEDFKNILKQLEQNQSSAGIFYEVLNEDLDGKVDGKLTSAGRGGSKVKLSVLGTYEKNKKPGSRSKYQTLVTTDIPDALKEFKQMDAFKGKEDLNKGTVAESTKTVDDAFQMITTQLNEIAGLVDSSKGTQHTADGQKNGVNNYLEDITSLLGKDTVTLTSDIKSAHSSVQGLVTIKTQLEMLNKDHLTEESGQIVKAIDEIVKLIQGLEAVPKNVNEKRNEAELLMESLKNRLDGHLSAIEMKITDADRIMSAAIVVLENALQEARRNAEQSVTSAFSTLTSEVRSLFADAHKADLAALKTLVDGQKEEIEGIIRSAKITGVMGLIRKMHPNKSDFEQISEFVTPVKLKAVPTKEDFTGMSSHFRKIVDSFLEYTEYQVSTSSGDPHKRLPTDQSEKVRHLKDAFDALLHYLKQNGDLTRQYLFDHHFDDLLASLNALVSSLSPSFSSPSPLLAPLKTGLSKFAEQLGHAYVNRYSGRKRSDDWVTTETKNVDDTRKTEQITKLTPEGRNCAKVCLTIVEMVSEELDVLREKCKLDWHSKQIDRISVLGSFLAKCGYVVSDRDKQDGELQRSDKMMGENVLRKLHEKKFTEDAQVDHLLKCETNKYPNGDKIKSLEFDIFNVLKCLHHHLETYYNIGHMATLTAKRNPCSVYEMLVWCAGLLYNPVNSVMQHATITELFEDPEKGNAEDEIIMMQVDKNFIDAAPHAINYQGIVTSLTDLCAQSYDVLTRVLGTGDAETTYASDYCNNSHNFYYPQKGDDCLDMLLDILRRMFPPLKFLMHQCSYPTGIHGWSSCQYGKDVSSAKWPCKGHPKDKPNDQPNDEPTCQPKSPLQSYLNDSLAGWLPHSLSGIGCRPKCANCPGNKPGMQCLTPLGFRGFSGTTRTGRDICDVLEKYFTNTYHTSLFSLVPRPPSTLAEHHSFVLSLMRGINAEQRKQNHGIKTLSEAFDTSISKLTIELYKDAGTLTDALADAYCSRKNRHEGKNHLVAFADLESLSMKITCPGKDALCAPYLSSLASDSYYYMTNKNTDTYLSWVTYLPWTFWNLLNSLYNSFCAINCQDWGCRGCLRGDVCKKGSHGVVDKVKPNAVCKCDSIVQCKGVSATLYQYGLCFGEPYTLSDGKTMKKCSDFCTQLSNVLNSTYFSKLFEKCDEFIFTIRQPFIWLNVALWSLSLFYLICVMVGRLDVLHIRSHLRTPSSHRITAQSLLAAAQVGRLAKISYLQP
ncbi:hypothetical protein, conserved [Babesia bigemina]|uniref:C3H1-type domain-containing protein n=1 Tax=Babesia bigemina TaxID=5866 RepID=A0A061BQU7_BABBI|nr:hypothetical protein, conserved [Babesia bigemina]CDR71838.1 hypothetical protein, conserved [Babesia bigemina]|eukprot:XP_012770781.1 hypothetical protein, conserved [Babesia bigemina]